VSGFKQFKSGAQFGAWIGLASKQHASGGKCPLGTITRRGDTSLRTLLIQGSQSVVTAAQLRGDPSAAGCGPKSGRRRITEPRPRPDHRFWLCCRSLDDRVDERQLRWR